MKNQLQAISTSKHATHGYSLVKDHSFALQDSLAPILIDEISTLLGVFPLVFIVDANKNLLLVTLQGLHKNENLFLNDEAKWLVKQIPAVYRSYPFTFADSKDKENVLCFNMKSNLYREVPDTQAGDLRFFDDEGKMQKGLEDVLNFLSQTTKYKKLTFKALQAIKEVNILESFEIKTDSKEKEPLQGLLRINQKKLESLSAEELKALSDTSALSIIYAQLLSMSRINILKQLHELKSKKQKELNEKELDIDKFFSDAENDTLSFDF